MDLGLAKTILIKRIPSYAVSGSSTCEVLLHGLEIAAVLVIKWFTAFKCWRFIPLCGMQKSFLLLEDLGDEEPAPKAASILGLQVVCCVDVQRKELVLVFIVCPVPAFPCWLGGDAVHVCDHFPLHSGSSNSNIVACAVWTMWFVVHP